MIRVDRVNFPVDICISLRGFRNFLACLVGKGLRVMVVESYELYTVCSVLVRWRGLCICRIFAYRTRHTLCVARLFVGVAYVGSLLIERVIHSGVARLFVGVAYFGSLLIERGIHSV